MKKIISFLICFVMLMSFAACGKDDYIGVDKAKQAVADDIGAAIDDVEFALNDLITDDDGAYYDMRFSKDGKDYEYRVDALTGKVIDKNSTFDDDDNNSDMTNEENSDNTSVSDSTDNLFDNNDNTQTATSTTSM